MKSEVTQDLGNNAKRLHVLLQFMLFTDLCLIYFTFYGIIAVAITPNLIGAAVISGAFYGLFNLFAGDQLPCLLPFLTCNYGCIHNGLSIIHYYWSWSCWPIWSLLYSNISMSLTGFLPTRAYLETWLLQCLKPWSITSIFSHVSRCESIKAMLFRMETSCVVPSSSRNFDFVHLCPKRTCL